MTEYQRQPKFLTIMKIKFENLSTKLLVLKSDMYINLRPSLVSMCLMQQTYLNTNKQTNKTIETYHIIQQNKINIKPHSDRLSFFT